MMTAPFDILLLIVFPYVALFMFLVGSLQRYRERPFTYSSLSSQFLENDFHFWGSVPFHYGILVVLAGHLTAFAIPRGLLLWNGAPLRLYALETTGFAFALFALVGLLNLIVRRFTMASLRRLTTLADGVLLGILFVQIGLGIEIAFLHPWGSSWFATSLSPYLWSLCRFAPDLRTVSPLPLNVKLHIVLAFALLSLIPFSRLVHVLVLPLPYLWRKPQVVRWWRAQMSANGRNEGLS